MLTLDIAFDEGTDLSFKITECMLTRKSQHYKDFGTAFRSRLVPTISVPNRLILGVTDGTATFKGDITILGVLATAMVKFDPLFEIPPGTRDGSVIKQHSEAFEAVTWRPSIE